MTGYVDDLTKVKPEEVWYEGTDKEIIAIVRVTHPLREEFAIVVVFSTGCSGTYTIDGRSTVGSCRWFTYKPRKVAYIKPLHVVLSENDYRFDEFYNRIYICARQRNAQVSAVSFCGVPKIFGKPVLPGSNYPESWIEYREEE